jgi:hypothetical protein
LIFWPVSSVSKTMVRLMESMTYTDSATDELLNQWMPWSDIIPTCSIQTSSACWTSLTLASSLACIPPDLSDLLRRHATRVHPAVGRCYRHHRGLRLPHRHFRDTTGPEPARSHRLGRLYLHGARSGHPASNHVTDDHEKGTRSRHGATAPRLTNGENPVSHPSLLRSLCR